MIAFDIADGRVALSGDDANAEIVALALGARRWRTIPTIPTADQSRLRWTDDGDFAVVDPAPVVPDQMTFAQLLIGLVAEGWITEAEGDAWLEGRIPAAALGLIATLPQAQRFAAKARAARPSVILRNDPLVTALATAQGRADDLDRFFTTYAAV